MNTNKTTAVIADAILGLLFVCVVVLVGASIYFALIGLLDKSQEKFEGACDYLGGKVYVMDFDHRVCIKGGKVVLRDE